jgi:hypothetical protein
LAEEGDSQVVHLLHSETMTYQCCIQVGRSLIE